MTDRKDPKKSESIEVRVPWRLKQEFMARARREGRSASEVIRDLMEGYVRRPAQRSAQQTLETAMNVIRKRPRAGFAAVLGAAGISAVLASTIPAGAAPDLRAHFMHLDANGDGIVTMAEIAPQAEAHVHNFELQGPAPDQHAASGVETYGPFLLPVSQDGQTRILMIQMTRDSSGAIQTVDHLPPTPMVAEFQAGDMDSDGALSFEEFVERYNVIRDRSFDALDADADGLIAGEEIAGNPLDGPNGGQVAAGLRSIDADGDGRVTRAEFADAV